MNTKDFQVASGHWVGIHVTAKFGVIRKPLLNNFPMSTFVYGT
jgi:hypothetical protein